MSEVSERERPVRRNLDVRKLHLGGYLNLRLYQKLSCRWVCERHLRDWLLVEICVVNAVVVQHNDVLVRTELRLLFYWDLFDLTLPRVRPGLRLLRFHRHLWRARPNNFWLF